MTVLVTMEVPFGRQDIERLSEQIAARENPPAGLIVHVVTESDSGCAVTDVWDSEESFRQFHDSVLTPAIEKMATEAGHAVGAPPSVTVRDAYDLVVGRD